MALISYQGCSPQVDPTAFIAPSAQVIGEVEIGPLSSVWFNAVIRGDANSIRIGAQTNIQDLCCLHGTRGTHAVTVGDKVTVGHQVTLHGCTIGHSCLIGMGAIVLDGVRVEEGCFIGAGTLLTPGTHVPAGSMVLGSPGRVLRPVTQSERDTITRSVLHYLDYASAYR